MDAWAAATVLAPAAAAAPPPGSWAVGREADVGAGGLGLDEREAAVRGSWRAKGLASVWMYLLVSARKASSCR